MKHDLYFVQYIIAADRFDCYDPFHLGWLLKDNRKFLDILVWAEFYSDKVTFADLNPVMLLSSFVLLIMLKEKLKRKSWRQF